MPIDGQKLNTIYNQLKELVGQQGAFVLILVSPNGDQDEGVQIRTFGPPTRVIGTLDTCVPIARENVIQIFNKRIQRLPPEPD
jgi:hypothetical protein